MFTVNIHEPVCDGDVPYLSYEVAVSDPKEGDTLTITWVNPDGDDVVYTDQPLKGKVLWPGAEVSDTGEPLDWPGWSFVNGVWVEANDGFEWTRPSVKVIFSVNPTETFTIGYPPATPTCNANPPSPTPSLKPPPTDTDTRPADPSLVPLAALMLVGGAFLILFGARRRV